MIILLLLDGRPAPSARRARRALGGGPLNGESKIERFMPKKEVERRSVGFVLHGRGLQECISVKPPQVEFASKSFIHEHSLPSCPSRRIAERPIRSYL